MDKSLVCNYEEKEYPKQGETEEVICCYGKGKYGITGSARNGIVQCVIINEMRTNKWELIIVCALSVSKDSPT